MGLVPDIVHILVFLNLHPLELSQVLLIEVIFYRRLVAVTHVHTAQLLLGLGQTYPDEIGLQIVSHHGLRSQLRCEFVPIGATFEGTQAALEVDGVVLLDWTEHRQLV